MGEAQFNPHLQQRLTAIVHEGRVIGHGQQLAKVHGTNRPAPIVVGRQQIRRQVRRAKLAEMARLQREADAAAVSAARVGRRPIKKAPGLMLSYAAVIKKARKQPFRSVRELDLLPNADLIPAGCEATFHATKGLRVVRSETV